MRLFPRWSDYFINNHFFQNTDNKINMNSCWKALDHSLNNCEELTQWEFVPLVPTFTYTTSNLKNLRNFLEANKFIDVNRCNNKNLHTCHKLPQACWEANPYVQFKYIPLKIWNPTQELVKITCRLYWVHVVVVDGVDRVLDKYLYGLVRTS